ncbi:hypothetical protein [Marisediminicola sp. LYQ134]|uniref:hypothetical protein n=1 Tax=Marisediminicola sp. LYQ134 TaxID=3391061 RepID=UPI003983A36D
MSNPPNIARVLVEGVEVSRDHDLSAERTFEFQTDEGNFYRVVAAESGRQQTWTVTKLEERREIPAGTVRHEKPWLIFGSIAHHYFRPGAHVSSGFQNDLWNAVQSLAV